LNGRVHITAIGTSIGTTRIDNIAQAAAYGRDAAFVEERLGPIQLPQSGSAETAVSLAQAACNAALETSGVAPEQIGLLIMVTQNPDHGGLPHNSAILQHALGLPTTAMCFDIGLGCSGYVYGLSTIEALMVHRGISHALLVTSDQYRRHLITNDINTQLLFGDGAAATVLQLDEGLGYCWEGATLGTDGTHHKALIRTPEGIAMNGRVIYGFSRKVVPNAIRNFLTDRGLTLTEVDQVLLHQGSQAILDEISKALELPAHKVPTSLTQMGNTVSSSLPSLLQIQLERRDADQILLAGFGVGLSYGVGLLTKV